MKPKAPKEAEFRAFFLAAKPHPKTAAGPFHLTLESALAARAEMGERGKHFYVFEGVCRFNLEPADKPEDRVRAREARKGKLKLSEGPLGAKVIVYTDGSITKNPGGFGGWAFLAVWDEDDGRKTYEASGGLAAPSTNNQAELAAALEGLKWVHKRFGGWVDVQVVSDSQYVVRGAREWLDSWIRRGWRTSTGTAVVNRALWEDVLKVTSGLLIKWTWVKGHSGHPENEYVDRLAGIAAKDAESAAASGMQVVP